ncbi:biotin synthase BioB, partial [bacterium]|nr:biotin synthase BioB [bacterium]
MTSPPALATLAVMLLRTAPPQSFPELSGVYRQPLFDLLEQAREVHRGSWGDREGVQLCRLLSIKTGGCSEDCAYCAQSSRYDTGVKAERLMDRETVMAEARQAKAAGAGRFCMGAAW